MRVEEGGISRIKSGVCGITVDMFMCGGSVVWSVVWSGECGVDSVEWSQVSLGFGTNGVAVGGCVVH